VHRRHRRAAIQLDGPEDAAQATATQIPSAASATATGRLSRDPDTSTFSTKITP
jgi:hypothetical protein